MKEGKGTVVDVRTGAEFSGGHVSEARNIPLNEIPSRLDEFREMASPIIVCCASGMRSEQAKNYLKNQNISCINGGSWLDVNYLQSKNL